MTLAISAFCEGTLLGLGLYSSMGPKDLFVIRYCLHNKKISWVIALCVGSDALLTALGMAGVGSLMSKLPFMVSALNWAAILYLLWYGAKVVVGMRQPTILHIASDGQRKNTLVEGILVSLLNPTAWLDTVLLIGSILASKAAEVRHPLAWGTIFASFLWFLALALASRYFRGFITRPRIWTCINGAAGLLLLLFGARLAADQFFP